MPSIEMPVPASDSAVALPFSAAELTESIFSKTSDKSPYIPFPPPKLSMDSHTKLELKKPSVSAATDAHSLLMSKNTSLPRGTAEEKFRM